MIFFPNVSLNQNTTKYSLNVVVEPDTQVHKMKGFSQKIFENVPFFTRINVSAL